MFNRLKIFADTLGLLLQPGEQARALQQAAYFDGEEDLGQSRPDLGAEIVDMALLWHSAYFQGLADRLVTGRSLVGWPGCEAQELARTVGGHDLLVTDRRLLVVDLGDSSQPPEILWTRDRMHIATIRRAPRFAQAGRIWVVLADGSAVSLMLGVLDPRGAQRVVAAWGEIEGSAE